MYNQMFVDQACGIFQKSAVESEQKENDQTDTMSKTDRMEGERRKGRKEVARQIPHYPPTKALQKLGISAWTSTKLMCTGDQEVGKDSKSLKNS